MYVRESKSQRDTCPCTGPWVDVQLLQGGWALCPSASPPAFSEAASPFRSPGIIVHRWVQDATSVSGVPATSWSKAGNTAGGQ